MATLPKIVKNLSYETANILNVIRNNASQNFQDFIPEISDVKDLKQVRAIGNIMMQYPALQNEFLSALVNRIGRVLITSKLYKNPWASFKKGMLEYGETVEEIFVNLARPFEFDPAVAESEVFKREIPDVRAAFHTLNYQKFYKSTISQDQLRQAFLSLDGVTDLIGRIVDAIYTSAEYDELQTMKYLLARQILNGRLYPSEIGTISAANMKSAATTIKGASNALEFMSPSYNIAGVMTHSSKDDQYLIMSTSFDAAMDVEVLASAFNMDKAEFLGHRVLVDGFGNLDTNRLNELFNDDPYYSAITSAELTALNAIPAVLVDRDFFMIFDNLINFTENYNGQGLYWNYFYHTWKTFSVSPFANALVFVPGAPAVTGIEVTPETATVAGGQKLQMSAVVTTTNFAPQSVNWSVVDSNSEASEEVTINAQGLLEVSSDATAGDYTVTATSVYDSSVSGTATITVA